jgi:hypothetical protein
VFGASREGFWEGVERTFDFGHAEEVPIEAAQPDLRHVWVRGHNEYAPVHPGLVISWQFSPVDKVTDSAWTALVVVSPFPGAMLVEWVNADRLEAIRDPTPADGS